MPLTLVVNNPGANPQVIPYEEAPGSPREGCQGNVFRATRTFLLPWSQRWSFCAALMGYPFLKQTGGDWWISRVAPLGYPARDLDPLADDQARKWLYPVGIESVEGVGKILFYDQDGVASYDTARVTLAYEALTYHPYPDGYLFGQAIGGVFLPGLPIGNPGNPFVPSFLTPGGGIDESSLVRYVTKFRQPTAEYLTLPFGALNWVQPGGPVPCPGSIGRIVSSTEIMYVWHQVPNIPDSAGGTTGKASLLGYVNDRPFDVYPRGTLLLTSIDIKPYRWFFNQRVFDITYKMKYFQPDGGVCANFDGTPMLDVGNKPVNEYYGHNFFLRYQNLTGASSPPVYQMLSNDGVAPLNVPAVPPPAKPTSGVTVYPYADFRNLFRPAAPVAPPE